MKRPHSIGIHVHAPIRLLAIRSVFFGFTCVLLVNNAAANSKRIDDTMLSFSRQRSRSDACMLSDGTILLASEWIRGQNLRRVSLHRCVITPKGFRCSGPVDIPLPHFSFGQSHPQLVCEGLPRELKAQNPTGIDRRGTKGRTSGPVSDVPANTPLLYLRQGHLARGLTRLRLYAVFSDLAEPGEKRGKKGSKETPKDTAGQRTDKTDMKKILRGSGGVSVKKVAVIELPSTFDGKDMVATATSTKSGEIRLTAHENRGDKIPHLWLMESRNGWSFSKAHPIFPGQDGIVVTLKNGRLLAAYRIRTSKQSPPQTFARMASQPEGPWSPPIRISTDLIHLGPPSIRLHHDDPVVSLFAAALHQAVGSNSLFQVELQVGPVKQESSIEKKTTKTRSIKTQTGSEKNKIRILSMKRLLPFTKERRLHAQAAQSCKTSRKSGVLLLYAQELKELRFELRGLLFSE